MWSLGCVIYELMKYATRKEHITKELFQNDRFLCCGTSCYPLSPVKKKEGDESEATVIGLGDQMLFILKSLGCPKESDVSFLTSVESLKYINELQSNIDKINKKSQ